MSSIPDNIKIETLHQDNLLPNYREIVEQQSGNRKRKLEYFLGRQAANNCLANFGSALEFPHDSFTRGVKWPTGYIGSISHSLPHAASIVVSKTDYLNTGIDIELKNRKFNPKLALRIANENELAWIKQDQNNSQLRTLILFSAKESVYKAVQNYIDSFSYKNISIQIEDDKFTCNLLNSENNFDINLHYSAKEHLILTYCLISNP